MRSGERKGYLSFIVKLPMLTQVTGFSLARRYEKGLELHHGLESNGMKGHRELWKTME